jgi:4-hydroxybenzoate polyprenyltransferase
MAVAASPAVSFTTLLRLGRVSNLPTVWTNVLAGTVLAGGEWRTLRTLVALIAMSLFYIGGMYLNDYFDRSIDARERPERPIPAGDISAVAVRAIGFALLAGAVALMLAAGTAAAVTGLLLALCIVGYDLHHKGVALAPAGMGACRALVYCGAAAAAVGNISATVAIAAVAAAAYVAGLTYAARQESLDKIGSLWPLALLALPLVPASGAFGHGPIAIAFYAALIGWGGCATYLLVRRPVAGAVSRAVAWLIAGLSLVDAAFLAGVGAIVPACWAAAGFGATLALQRHIAGT